MIENLIRYNASDSEAAFESKIVGPLESVLGETLLAVSYWILGYDRDGFSAEQPNASGMVFAVLHFETCVIEVSWGWERLLRGSDLSYHIQLLPMGQTASTEAMTNSKLCEIKSTDTAVWEGAVGKRLTGAEVIGFQNSPQAVRFSFFDADVVIAIGYAGDNLLVGDGDDLLVFSKWEWQRQKSIYGGEWESLWTTSATSQSELLTA